MDEKIIKELISKAAGMRKISYTPYSKFNVGAALLATGGTMKAALNLVNKFHPKKTYMNFLIELVNEGLNGRQTIGDGIEVTTLLEV